MRNYVCIKQRHDNLVTATGLISILSAMNRNQRTRVAFLDISVTSHQSANHEMPLANNVTILVNRIKLLANRAAP